MHHLNKTGVQVLTHLFFWLVSKGKCYQIFCFLFEAAAVFFKIKKVESCSMMLINLQHLKG